MEKLIESAKAAMENSYSPYSKFKVGAAVLSESNNIYSGCNIENASYGATVCAERTAVLKAVSTGEKKITKIAIVSASETMPYPCGMCLQVLSEFAGGNLEIIIVNCWGKIEITLLKNLMPKIFKLEK